jgi:two-component system, OmpR family, response regulator
VTIRILADREPYSTFADAHCSEGAANPLGFVASPYAAYPDSLVILSGPAGLDDPCPDIIVMPVEDFLILRGRRSTESVLMTLYIPYGPVALMEKAFELGCTDYIREPWSLTELRARGSRLLRLKFKVGEKTIVLAGMRLIGETASVELTESERALLRLLVLNIALPVPRETAISSLPSPARYEKHALGRCITSLRRKMDGVEPGLGARLLAIRGFGYRLDAVSCG